MKRRLWVVVGGCIGLLAFGSAWAHVVIIPEGILPQAGLSATFVARFALFIACVLLWTVAWGKILKKLFRLPVIAGQIIGGILLGPSWLHIQDVPVFAEPIKILDQTSGIVYALASSDLFLFVLLLISSALTVSYLLWVAGHETDIKDIMHVGVTALSAGVLGALLPIIMSAAFTFYFLGWYMIESVALGLIFAATSVSIPVAMLFSLNKMHLKSSKATLGAAVIDDILAVIFLSVFFVGVQSGVFGEVIGVVMPDHGGGLVEAIIYLVVSFAVIFCTGFFVIPPLVRWLRGHNLSHLVASLAHGVMLVYFAFAELIGGLAGITGAYFAGLFHRMGDTRHHAEKTISPFVNVFLLPLFLGSIGLQLNIRILHMHEWGIVGALLIIAIISKLLGCFIATWLSNVSGRRGMASWRPLEGYLFGSSMIARGEVGLVIATILNGSHVITPQQYVIAVVVIVLTTVVSPIMLAMGFHWLTQQLTLHEGSDGYRMNIGPFSVVGTTQMFNIISGVIETSGQYTTSINFSEGRRILNLEGQQVKVILCPNEGLVFEGPRERIEQILQEVKGGIHADLDKLVAGG